MPCACICATCSGRSRRPRMPPWICGTRVFTRPSRISGKPVWSDTSFTATPASRNARAEPPVDRISTPALGQRRGERHQPGLVGDGDQRAANGDDVGHGGAPVAAAARDSPCGRVWVGRTRAAAPPDRCADHGHGLSFRQFSVALANARGGTNRTGFASRPTKPAGRHRHRLPKMGMPSPARIFFVRLQGNVPSYTVDKAVCGNMVRASVKGWRQPWPNMIDAPENAGSPRRWRWRVLRSYAIWDHPGLPVCELPAAALERAYIAMVRARPHPPPRAARREEDGPRAEPAGGR